MTEKLDELRHAYIFHEESGVCLYYHAFTDMKIDPQLISGFISAITSIPVEDGTAKKKRFKKDKTREKPAPGLKELVYQEYRILMQDLWPYKFAFLIAGTGSDVLRSKIAVFINHFAEKFGDTLKGWKGGKVDYVQFKAAGTMIASDLS